MTMKENNLCFWLIPHACGILVPPPGSELAVEVRHLNHRTTREVLKENSSKMQNTLDRLEQWDIIMHGMFQTCS